METISIIALVLGVVAVILLAVTLALVIKGRKRTDATVEIGQATVDIIKGEVARDGQATRENVMNAMGLQNTTIQNALSANHSAIVETVRKRRGARRKIADGYVRRLRHNHDGTQKFAERNQRKKRKTT